MLWTERLEIVRYWSETYLKQRIEKYLKAILSEQLINSPGG